MFIFNLYVHRFFTYDVKEISYKIKIGKNDAEKNTSILFVQFYIVIF